MIRNRKGHGTTPSRRVQRRCPHLIPNSFFDCATPVRDADVIGASPESAHILQEEDGVR